MRRALYSVKWYFSRTDLNTEKGKAENKKSITKYVKWYTPEREKQYPTSFKVDFVGQPHEGACYYRITRCPICVYAKKLGVAELMPLFCELDSVMIALQHGVLHRSQTIASGGDYCDYYITGSREWRKAETLHRERLRFFMGRYSPAMRQPSALSRISMKRRYTP